MRSGLVTLVITLSSLSAQAAGLDLSFGDGGLLFSPFVADEQPGAVLRTPEGNLVVLGRTWGTSTSSILGLRFSPDAVADDSFGGAGLPEGSAPGGLVSSPGAASSGALGGAVDDEGRILVAGYAFANHGAGLAMDAVVARLRPDGALDDSFGDGGVVLLDVFGFDDQANDVIALADGRVIAAGRTTVGFAAGVVETRAVVWALDAKGALDVTFAADGGSAGARAFAVEGEQDALVAVDVDAAGGIVVAGTAVYAAGGRASVVVARLQADGTLDPTFAASARGSLDLAGAGIFDPGAFFASAAVSVDVEGSRVLVGATVDNGGEDPDLDLGLVELDDDGDLLRTTTASVHVLKGQPAPTRDDLRDLVVLADGSALLAGDSGGHLVLVHVLASGAIDEAFVGGDHPALLEIAPCGASARAASLALVEGGAVLAAGCFLDPFYADLVLARVTLDPAAIGEGEGEGEGAEGEGEDEGEIVGEGEGEPVGEGEGEPKADGCGCAAGSPVDGAVGLGLALALICRPQRRLR